MPQRGYAYCKDCDRNMSVVWPGDEWPGRAVEYEYTCPAGHVHRYRGGAWTEVDDTEGMPILRLPTDATHD